MINILDNNYNKEFYLDCYNDVSHYSKDYLLKLVNKLESNNTNKNDVIYNIFQISLYYYQKSNETAYLWKKDFSPFIDSLMYHY